MHETLQPEQKEEIKHNFLKALEREFSGVEYEVVIENGVALVLAWGSIFKKGITENITSKFRNFARTQNLAVETFIAGGQTFPTVKITLVPQVRVYGLFNLFNDNKPIDKKGNWDIVSSEDGDVVSVSLKVVGNGINSKNFLTDYARMIAFVKNQFGSDFETDFGLSGVNADLLKILLMKKLSEN